MRDTPKDRGKTHTAKNYKTGPMQCSTGDTKWLGITITCSGHGGRAIVGCVHAVGSLLITIQHSIIIVLHLLY